MGLVRNGGGSYNYRNYTRGLQVIEKKLINVNLTAIKIDCIGLPDAC